MCENRLSPKPQRGRGSSVTVVRGPNGPTAVYLTPRVSPAAAVFAVGTAFGGLRSLIVLVRQRKHGGA